MRIKDTTLGTRIIEYVETYYSSAGKSPSTREIAEGISVSRPTVQRYLKDLKNAGAIEYDGHRSILTQHIKDNTFANYMRIPIVGTIPCGDFNDVVDTSYEYHCFPKTLVGDGDFFLLIAKGDSMKDAGIENGDLVLVSMSNVADNGQIVAVLYDNNQTTLKRLFQSKDSITLHPENKMYEDIVIKGKDRNKVIIQGVAKMIIKMLG